MATATFNGTVIAESDDIETVEGNAYFPVASLERFHPWKNGGLAEGAVFKPDATGQSA